MMLVSYLALAACCSSCCAARPTHAAVAALLLSLEPPASPAASFLSRASGVVSNPLKNGVVAHSGCGTPLFGAVRPELLLSCVPRDSAHPVSRRRKRLFQKNFSLEHTSERCCCNRHLMNDIRGLASCSCHDTPCERLKVCRIAQFSPANSSNIMFYRSRRGVKQLTAAAVAACVPHWQSAEHWMSHCMCPILQLYDSATVTYQCHRNRHKHQNFSRRQQMLGKQLHIYNTYQLLI
jgi:hypothetical protein